MILNKLCFVKSRNIAKTLCDKGMVLINDQPAKASNMVNEDDIITFSIYDYRTVVKILAIPKRNVPKKDSGEYYTIISRDRFEKHK